MVDAHRVIREYFESLDSPRALTCWLLFKAGGKEELHQLVTLSCNPDHYNSVEDFRSAYAATKFMSKCSGLDTGINTTDVAIEGAVLAEQRCLKTNLLWASLKDGSVRTEWEPEIHRAISIISKILGPVPNLFGTGDPFDGILTRAHGGWSKGRTTSASGPLLSPYRKYRSSLDVTVNALGFALRELRDSPQWGAAALEADAPVSVLPRALTIKEGNVMLTVPKNAKTDRVICYEPHVNIWLQLKVGHHLRERLKKSGVNLDHQSINQRRAKLGSKTGHLATVDLRSASDTVSCELVYQLLPIDWVCLLDGLRSRYTIWPDGVSRKNQKFSSMGNGFTFELESLLFYAICCAVSNNVSVYGDDIILPSKDYERATAFLIFCGFEVNLQKSYSSGCFRESCGGEYYLGSSCTPVYLRSIPKTIEDVVKLHNQVWRFAHANSGRGGTPWRPFGLLMYRWRRRYPHHYGPSGYGDGHYHTTFDDAAPRKAGSWVEGWWFTTYVRIYRKGVESIDGCTVSSLPAALCTSLGPKAVRSLFSSTVDRRNFRYKKIRVLANCWPEESWF